MLLRYYKQNRLIVAFTETNNARNDVSESVAINFRQSNNLCIFVKGTKLKASDREKNYKMMYTKFIQ